MLVTEVDQAEQSTHLCCWRFADGAGSVAPVTALRLRGSPAWCRVDGTQRADGAAVRGATAGRMAWAGNGRKPPNLQPQHHPGAGRAAVGAGALCIP